jgi:hypothetical protein
METEKKHFSFTLNVLKQFFVILLFVLSVVAFLGGLVYVLYRVAAFSRSLYGYIFLAFLCGVVVYFIVRGALKKQLAPVLLKAVRFFYVLFLVLFFFSVCMLYAGFIVRFPQIGIALTPVLVFVCIFAASKWKLFSWVRKVYRKLS